MTRLLLCRLAVAILAIAAAWIVPVSAPRAEDAGDKTIVFVCLHGVVNSQMAASYFNKVAKERGLPFKAVSRGIDLYRSVPVRIQDGPHHLQCVFITGCKNGRMILQREGDVQIFSPLRTMPAKYFELAPLERLV